MLEKVLLNFQAEQQGTFGPCNNTPVFASFGSKNQGLAGASAPVADVLVPGPKSIVPGSSEGKPPPCLLEVAEKAVVTTAAAQTAAENDQEVAPVEEPPYCLWFVTKLVQSDKFEFAFSLLIVVNAMAMAAGIQYQGLVLDHRHGYSPNGAAPPEAIGTFLQVLDILFTIAFTLELVLRLLGMRMAFFRTAWNWVDGVIVFFGLMESLLSGTIPLDPMMLRLLRLSKLAGKTLKSFRVIRIANFMETLSLIMKSLVASTSTLFWSMLLLFIVQCITGMIVSQLAFGFVDDADADFGARVQIFQYFGTFSKSLITMFEITHVSYAMASRLMSNNINENYAWIFIIYRCTICFAMVNVCRSVFLQQTLKVAADTRDEMSKAKCQASSSSVESLRVIWPGNGEEDITFDQFLELMDTECMEVWLKEMEVEPEEAEYLFQLVDTSGDGKVSLLEFVVGAAKLQGTPHCQNFFLTRSLLRRLDSLAGHSWHHEQGVGVDRAWQPDPEAHAPSKPPAHNVTDLPAFGIHGNGNASHGSANAHNASKAPAAIDCDG